MCSQLPKVPVPLWDFFLTGIATHAKAYPSIARLFVEKWIDVHRGAQGVGISRLPSQ